MKINYKNIELHSQNKNKTNFDYNNYLNIYTKNILFEISIIKGNVVENPGYIWLYNINVFNRTAGINIMFDMKELDRQTHKDIVNCLLKYAFLDLKFDKIFVEIIKEQYLKDILFQDLNFLCEGILRSHYFDGRRHDIIISSILNYEWTRRMHEIGLL